MHRLQAAFDALKSLDFPQRPESDELHEWLLELAEIDGHLAGLASSVIGGADARMLAISDIGSFADSLQKIDVVSESDRMIHARCMRYADRLCELQLALIEAGCRF